LVGSVIAIVSVAPVLAAEQRRDLLVFDEPQLDEIEPQLAPAGLLVIQGLLELLRGDPLLLQEEFAYPDGHGRLQLH
jgi:hypothetical protein